MPGVLALCVISSAFTGQAISTGFDRRYGVLRLLGVTPLGRTGLVLAKAVAVLAVIAVQVAASSAPSGAALGWEPALRGIPAAVVSLVLGTWAFTALALLLGGTLRAEGVLAVANLVWVALLGLGGVVVAGTELPGRGSRRCSGLLPSAALGDSLRAALVDGQAAPRALARPDRVGTGRHAAGAPVLPLERLTRLAPALAQQAGPRQRGRSRASQGRAVRAATTNRRRVADRDPRPPRVRHHGSSQPASATRAP